MVSEPWNLEVSWALSSSIFLQKYEKKQKHYSLYMCLNRWKKQELNGMDNRMDIIWYQTDHAPVLGEQMSCMVLVCLPRHSNEILMINLRKNVVQWLGIDCKTMSNVFTCKSWRNTAEESEDENLVLFQNRVPVNPMGFPWFFIVCSLQIVFFMKTIPWWLQGSRQIPARLLCFSVVHMVPIIW